MGALAQRDLDALLGFLHGLDEPADEEGFGQCVLGGLRELIEYDAAGYNDLDVTAGVARWLAMPWELGEAADRAAFERNMAQHPVLTMFMRTGEGRAVKVWDYLRPREFHALELYNDFYRPLTFEHQLIIQWAAGPERLLAVSLFRSRHDFSERDRRLLDLIRPYVILTQRSLQARMRTHALLTAFEHSAQRSGHGLVLSDGDGIIEAFGCAERWLSGFFDGDAPGVLPEEVARWARAQRKSGAATALVKNGELGRLEVEFVSGRSRGEPDALLLTLQPREPLSDANLRALGLTKREAQLLRLVASGKSDAAIGTQLCIGTDAVKKHLQRIYRKLDVHSRTAALAKARDAG